MTVKEWLNRAWRIEPFIQALIGERDSLRARVSCVRGISFEGERVQGGRQKQGDDLIAKCIDYEQQLDREIDRQLELKQEVWNAIEKVEDRELKTLLILRYLRFLPWEEIAEKMGYCDKWTRTRLHTKALNEVGKWITSL